MKIIFSTAAQVDLKSISNWIAEENPARAHGFVDELAASCEVLPHFPQSSPVVGLFEGDEVRRKIHGNYLIFYSIRHHQIEIVRVLHGAQDYSDLF